MVYRGAPSSDRKPIGPSLIFCLAVCKVYLVAWFETCADYYRAASFYEQLSHLSDAEFQHHGLRRSTLGWGLCQRCDRTDQRAAFFGRLIVIATKAGSVAILVTQGAWCVRLHFLGGPRTQRLGAGPLSIVGLPVLRTARASRRLRGASTPCSATDPECCQFTAALRLHGWEGYAHALQVRVSLSSGSSTRGPRLCGKGRSVVPTVPAPRSTANCRNLSRAPSHQTAAGYSIGWPGWRT